MPDPKELGQFERIAYTNNKTNLYAKKRLEESKYFDEISQEEADEIQRKYQEDLAEKEAAAFEAEVLKKQEEEAIRVEEAKQAQIQRDAEEAKLIEDSKPKNPFETSVMKENGLQDLFVYNTIKKEIEEFENTGVNAKNRKIDDENKKLDYFDNPGKALKNEFENALRTLGAAITPEGNEIGWIENKTKEQKEKYKENLEKLRKYEEVPKLRKNESAKSFDASIISPGIKKLEDELASLGSFGRIANPVGSPESMFKSEKENNADKEEYIKKVNRSKEIKDELTRLKSAKDINNKVINDLTNDTDKNSGLYEGVFGMEGYSKFGNSGLGFNKLHTEVQLAKAKAKNDNGEPLTNAEAILLQTGGVENEISKLRLNEGNTMYKLGDTVNGSIEFMAGLAGPNMITAPVKGALFQAIKSGFAKKVGKELVEEGAEKLVKESIEESVEAGVKGAVKGGVDNTLSKIATNTGSNIAGNAPKRLIGDATKQLFKEGVEKNIQESGEQLAKNGIVNTVKTLPEKSLKLGLDLAEAGTTPIFMPHTYNLYNQKMNDAIVLTKDANGQEIILTTKRQKEKYLDEFNKTKIIEQEKLSRLEKDPEGNKEEIKKIKEHLFDLQKDLDKIFDPETGKIPEDMKWVDAALHAYTETVKEILSEKFVGKGAEKLGKYVDAKILGNGITKLKSKASDFVFKKTDGVTDNFLGRSAGFISKVSAKNSQFDELFQSMPAEMAEEIVVQATPTYNAEKGGYVMSDYMKQLEELRNPEFYLLTAMSTGVIGGTMQGVSFTNGMKNYILGGSEYRDKISKSVDADKKADTDRRINVKDLNTLYKSLDKDVTDEKLATLISMNTGRTAFQGLSYDAAIAEERLKGNDTSAKILEDKAFNTMYLNALNTDSVDEFEKVMTKMVTTKGIHPDKIENALNMLNYTIPAGRQIEKKYGDYINLKEIKEVNNTINLFKMQAKGIEQVLPQIESKIKDKIVENIEAKNLPKNFTIDNIFNENSERYTEEENKQIKAFFDKNENDIAMREYNKEMYANAKQMILAQKEEYDYHTNPDNQKEFKKIILTNNFKQSPNLNADQLKDYKKAFNEIGVTEFDNAIDKRLGKEITKQAVKETNPEWVSNEDIEKETVDSLVKEEVDNKELIDEDIQQKLRDEIETQGANDVKTELGKTNSKSNRFKDYTNDDAGSEVEIVKNPIVTSVANKTKDDVAEELKREPEQEYNEAITPDVTAPKTTKKYRFDNLDADIFNGLTNSIKNFQEKSKEVNNATEEEKAEARKEVEIFDKFLKSKLNKKEGEELTLQEIVNHFIDTFGKENIKENFDGLLTAFLYADKNIFDADKVYTDTFGNNTDAMYSLFQKYQAKDAKINEQTTESVIESNNKLVENIQKASEKVEVPIVVQQFDTNDTVEDFNNEITNEELVEDEIDLNNKTTNPEPKASHLGVVYEVVKVPFEQDRLAYKEQSLNKSKEIDNNYISDPDYIKAGVELDVKIQSFSKVKDMSVGYWSLVDGKLTKEDMTFEKWVEKYAKNPENKVEKYTNLKEFIDKIEAGKDYNKYAWYWDKIPMIAKKGNHNIFFIHDVDWYNKKNVKGTNLANENGTVIQGKNYAKKVRQRIFEDKNSGKPSTIKITKRKFGNLFNLKKFNGDTSPVPLSEATTETTLYIAGENNTLGNKGDNRSVNLVGDTKLISGLLYDVRKVNVNEKSETEYIALNVITNDTRAGEPINDIAYNNIKAAVLALTYLKSFEKYPKLAESLENKDSFGMTKSKAELIVKAIRDTTGIDILADSKGKNGLKDYLAMFVGTVNNTALKFQLGNKEQNANGQDKFTNDANYIESNGLVLRIGLKGKVVGTGENGKVEDKDIPFINFGSLKNGTAPDFQVNKILELLKDNFEGDTGAFRKTRFMNSKSQLGHKDRNFVKFSSDGSIEKNEKGYTYDDYIKENVKSNIKSLTMQDVNGKTKSVTDIQAMVYYDFAENPIIGSETGKTSENVKTEEPSVKYNNPETPTPTKVNDKEAARLEKLDLDREDADFNNNNNNNETYTEEERFNDDLDYQKETPQEEVKSTKDRVNYILQSIISEDLKKLIIENGVISDYLNNLRNENIEELYNSVKNLTLAQQEGLTHLGFQKVSVLSSSEQTKLVDSLFNLISVDLLKSGNKITEEYIAELIRDSIKTYLQPKIDELNKITELLTNESYNANTKNREEIEYLRGIFDDSIGKLETVKSEQIKIKEGIIKKVNKSLAANIEIEELDNIVEAKEDDTTIDNNAAEGTAKNYSKSSLETSVKTSFSQELRLLFSGIKKQYNNGDTVTNFAGLPDHIDADEVVSSLLDITSRKNLDLDGLLETLRKMEHNPMFMQIHNAIIAAPEQTKTELMYKINVRRLDMYMLISTRDKYGNIRNLFKNITNAYANGLEAKWANDFRNSNVFEMVSGEYKKSQVINVINAITALEKGDLALGKTEESIAAIQKVLKMVGITVQDNTLIYLLNELPNNQKAKGTVLGSNGVLGLFKKSLEAILNNNNPEGVKFDANGNGSNNPFKFANTALALLIQIESYFAGGGVSKTFMSGSKSLQGVIQNNMAYQTLQNLKDKESTYFKDLKAIPYSKDNSLLKLIEEDNDFSSRFEISFVPLNVMRTITNKVDENDVSQGKETKLSGDVNSLSAADSSLAQISSFHNKMKDIKMSIGRFIFRLSNMYSHAIADKGQQLQFATAVLDLSPSYFNTNKNDVTASDDLLEYMLTQLFDSEFDRIISTHKNKTDINNYDSAAKYFLGIPIFNEISVVTEGIEVPIYDLLEEVAKSTNLASIEIAREKYRPAAKALLSEFLSAKLKEKVDETDTNSEWIKFGFLTNNVLKSELEIKQLSDKGKADYNTRYINSNFQIDKLDTEYVKKFSSEDLNTIQTSKMLALDFIVNDLLHKNNLHQLFTGDLALYSKGAGKFKKKDANTGRIVVDFIGLTQSIGDNLNKRFAMEIAPGNTPIMNDKTYMQVMVQDAVSITSTAEALITQYYGSVSKTNEKLLNDLVNVENEIQVIYALQANKSDEEIEKELEEIFEKKEKTMKALQKENKEIAGFFDIEGTDAQEYTTWKEHIDVMLGEGDMSEEDSNTLKSAYAKLSKGEEINNEELQVVMNTEKPMFGGHITTKDVNNNPIVNRVIYIKSSSIPLLPQLTKGIELDKIRNILESLEAASEKNVRMSFQTANKIGAIDTKLTLEDLYNTPFDRLYDKGNGKLAQSTLELNREGFRIQQKNIYKTEKNLKANKEDYIISGSQMWKGLMSGGISKETEAIFPNLFDNALIERINTELAKDDKELITSKKGEMISGVELDRIKFEVEKMYYNEKRKELYRDLGLNQTNGKPFDHDKSITKLHDLLKDECAKSPDDVIAGLKLVEWLGEITFMTPMWISSNASKFETILQALVYKRTMETKLPGYSHILASSEGFKRTKITASEDLTKQEQGDIVWLDGNRTGDLLATRKNEDGTLAFSEILIQSKFRKTEIINNKEVTTLIDLTQEPYSKRDENGVLVLNQEMIDEVLLSNFSYRIPTSGHQSGAMLKVVGFLPVAMGDVIVVPKEHTKQIGEDFDVDKRNVYKLNYEIKDKKIKVLEYNPSETDYKERLRMLENAMINTYSSVFSSPSDKIQKMINKILSMEDAVNATKMIDKRINEAKGKDRFFTIYSDTYQRNLLKAAIDGGLGTGIHSNAVTFQAQLERLPDGIQIMETIYVEQKTENYAKDGKTELVPILVNSEITIGTLTSSGLLGKIETIDGKRNIVDVNAENQNSSLDNIKATIMAKRNENKYTLNVLTQMTFRGFDAVSWDKYVTYENGVSKRVTMENQVTSLFLSQPILRRYVELMSEKESIFNEKKFPKEIEKEVLEQLLKEYDVNNISPIIINEVTGKRELDVMNFIDNAEYNIQSNNMTGEALYNDLIDDPKVYNSNMQIAVLAKFFKLKAESAELSKYQNLVSVSGLGLSYFNVLDKIETLNKLANETKFKGVQDLVGKFVNKDSAEYDELLKNGKLSDYTLIGDNWIKPTTTEGTVLINGIISAQHTMDLMFPYKNDMIQDILSEILGKESDSTGKKRYKILNSFKDFLHSQPLGLFEGNAKDERKRLFFDTDTHLSLSNFLNQLKNDNHRIFMENDLLKSLKFKVNFDGTPSTIEHFVSTDVVLDGGNKYDAFAQLLSDKTTILGIVNGVKMTPQRLAQELASYAYLSDNQAGITGFKKYVTIDYLNYLGIADNIRLKTDIDYLSLNNRNRYTVVQDFVRQYFQHNPEKLKEYKKTDFIRVNGAVELADYKKANKIPKKFKDNLKSFTPNYDIDNGKSPDRFIKIATTTPGNNGFYIYEFTGDEYVRIPSLGSANFVEYDMMTPYPTSLMNDKMAYDTTISSNEVFNARIQKYNDMNLDNILQFKREPRDTAKVNNLLDLSEGTFSLLKQIYTLSDNAKYQKFAEKLLPYIDTDIKVELFDPNDKVASRGLEEVSHGAYSEKRKTIYINQNMVANLYTNEKERKNVYEGIENVVLEEIIHSITIKEINKYFTIDDSGNPIPIVTEKGTPLFATKLAKLYEIAKQNLPYDESNPAENYYTSSFKEFVAGVFVSEEFRNELDSMKVGNKTLLQMFRDALASMLQFITGSTYSDVTINSIYEMLQTSKEEKRVDKVKVNTNSDAAQNLIERLKESSPEVDVETKTSETLFDKIKNSKSEVPASIPVKEDNVEQKIENNELNDNNELTESIKNKQITPVNEFDNKTELNNEDYVAYEKTVRDLSEKLASRIGATVKFENDKKLDYQSKIIDDVIYVNLASATITTPVHSILSVPIVKALRQENEPLYRNLLEGLQEAKGIEILSKLNGENDNSIQDNQELAIAELLSLYTTDKLNQYKDKNIIGLFKGLFAKISKFLKSLLKAKELEIAALPDNMTIKDLANLFAYSKSNLLLPNHQVTYTTPDNNKFKTFDEANNHITNLIKEYESYTQEEIDEAVANVKVSPTRESSLIYGFIDSNNQFERSKIVVEEFKKVNDIVYNPQEVYSRGHEFVSVIGAYVDFDVNLMMQNLLEHISDNKKAGTKFTISSFTKPVGTRVNKIEGEGGKIRFKIQPKSEDIEWAANVNCYSGSSLGASDNINPDITSEILGVSYTKSPTLLTLKNVQPNLANIIDNISDRHNELGITLTGENFRLEYDEDIPYETKQILNNINSILDQKYGKFENEIISKLDNKRFELSQNLSFEKINKKKAERNSTKEEVLKISNIIDKLQKQIDDLPIIGITPIQTEDNIKMSINDINLKNRQENIEKEKLQEVIFTEKAANNLKIAALKQFAKKYPRILITSKVEKIEKVNVEINEKIAKLPEIKKCEF